MSGPKHGTPRKGESKGAAFKVAEERESSLKRLPSTWGKDDGYRSRISPISGWNIIELDCWADPRKTEQWGREMMGAIGPQRFQREYLRNWALSTQTPFFPEWTNRGGMETFGYELAELSRRDIVVGLDFGFRRPAVIVGQTNPLKTRLYLFREWMPRNLSAPAFMEVVEWLLGELEEWDVGPEGQRHIHDLRTQADAGKGPPVPWLRRPSRVVRYSGPEALRVSQEVTSEAAERRVADIWANRGFPLTLQAQPIEAGAMILRHLMRHQPKKAIPYLIVDPWCEITVEAFDGGYTYKRPTRDRPQPKDPAKDGYYEHMMDAVRYLAVAAIDPLRLDKREHEDNVELKKAQAPKPSGREPGSYSRAEVGRSQDEELFSNPFLPAPARRRGVYSREER